MRRARWARPRPSPAPTSPARTRTTSASRPHPGEDGPPHPAGARPASRAPPERDGTLVEVALPVPANGGVFTYRLPEGAVEPGRRVLVPLGRRTATGVVLGPARSLRGELRDVLRVLDEQPLLPPDVLQLVRWAAAHYLAPLGLAVRVALPPGIDLREELRGALTPDGDALLDGVQRALLPGGQEAATRTRQLLRAVREGRALRAAQLRALEKRGLVSLSTSEARPRVQAPQVELAAAFPGARPHLRKLAARRLVALRTEPAGAARLPDAPWGSAVVRETAAQSAALVELRAALDARAYAPFLLDGVTGSGKTHVYLEAIAHARGQGRGALALVPEIALTPQLAGRFRARFGDDVAVLHSGLTERERLSEWHRVRGGGAGVVVGARSAVFAPVRDLGIVVVDEEHEPSYKQEDRLRYHARDLALVRARDAGGAAVGCPYCSVALVLHRASGAALRCHLCGHEEVPRPCAACGSDDLVPLSAGTERVEEELRALLPQARVARLDRDSAGGPGKAAALLARFARRELDVLIGT